MTETITLVIPAWPLIILAIGAWVQIGLSAWIALLRWQNNRLSRRIADKLAADGLVDRAGKVAGERR